MSSTKDAARNAETACALVEKAADMGASLAGLPENWTAIRDNDDPPPAPLSINESPLSEIRDICRRRELTLVAGTIPEKGPGDKIYNTCPVFGPDGELIGKYRKIHLFDVFIKDGADHQESKIVEPGDRAVVLDTPRGKIGLTVCYDLRFPELFRRMALDGARMIFVPAAFTLFTGKDHWMPLLRARAIENLVYIAAPAQTGRHTARRQSFGKSLIADPWGAVLACAPDREAVATAEIDFEAQDAMRAKMPTLTHVKPWLAGGDCGKKEN